MRSCTQCTPKRSPRGIIATALWCLPLAYVRSAGILRLSRVWVTIEMSGQQISANVAGMRILVTNDDGIASPGLHEVARTLHEDGHDVIVAAPLDDCTGAGAGVGEGYRKGSISFQREAVSGLAGVDAFGVDALPALIVLAACLGGFGEPPEIVVSGINLGLNTGRAVLHSGTVGAALTASHFGVSSLAVSVEPFEPVFWDPAAKIAASVVGKLARSKDVIVLNLNVPGIPLSEVRGVRQASLSTRGAALSIQSDVGKRTISGLVEVEDSGSGMGTITLNLGWPTERDGVRTTPDSDHGAVVGRRGRVPSDVELVNAGYAAVTLIKAVSEDTRPTTASLLDDLALGGA